MLYLEPVLGRRLPLIHVGYPPRLAFQGRGSTATSLPKLAAFLLSPVLFLPACSGAGDTVKLSQEPPEHTFRLKVPPSYENAVADLMGLNAKPISKEQYLDAWSQMPNASAASKGIVQFLNTSPQNCIWAGQKNHPEICMVMPDREDPENTVYLLDEAEQLLFKMMRVDWDGKTYVLIEFTDKTIAWNATDNELRVKLPAVSDEYQPVARSGANLLRSLLAGVEGDPLGIAALLS